MENRAAILAQFDGFARSLDEIVEHLRDGRFDELEKLLERAQRARLRLTDESDE